MRSVNRLFACIVIATAAACSGPAVLEGQGSASSHLQGGRYNPDEPAVHQNDKWSCSVHTGAWMLRASGIDQTVDTVSDYMLGAGEVTTSDGLSDASGAGLARTLRHFADGNPDIGNDGAASFEDVAARAGRMAVGIGGRSWNHWSAVRGYDAERGVLLLANSAIGYDGIGETMNSAEFARVGSMSMVWIDYGGGASSSGPSYTPADRPPSDPFPPLHVRASLPPAIFVTQCSVEEDAERVWQTDGSGPDPSTRWAPAMYPEEAKQGCGAGGPNGYHPLVFRGLGAGELGGAWIVQCSGYGDGAQHVFRVDTEVDGHPAATFLYDEANPECD